MAIELTIALHNLRNVTAFFDRKMIVHMVLHRQYERVEKKNKYCVSFGGDVCVGVVQHVFMHN